MRERQIALFFTRCWSFATTRGRHLSAVLRPIGAVRSDSPNSGPACVSPGRSRGRSGRAVVDQTCMWQEDRSTTTVGRRHGDDDGDELMVRRRQHRRRGCDGRNDRRCDVHDGDSDRIGRRAVAAVGNGQREHMSSRRQRDCRSDTRRGAKRSGPRVRQTIAVGIRGHAAVQRYVCETAGIGSHRPIRADVRNWRRIRRRELVRSHVDARIAVEVTVEDARVSVEIRRGELRRRIVPGIGRGASGLQV